MGKSTDREILEPNFHELLRQDTNFTNFDGDLTGGNGENRGGESAIDWGASGG
jgi:hypothetical protein